MFSQQRDKDHFYLCTISRWYLMLNRNNIRFIYKVMKWGLNSTRTIGNNCAGLPPMAPWTMCANVCVRVCVSVVCVLCVYALSHDGPASAFTWANSVCNKWTVAARTYHVAISVYDVGVDVQTNRQTDNRRINTHSPIIHAHRTANQSQSLSILVYRVLFGYCIMH